MTKRRTKTRTHVEARAGPFVPLRNSGSRAPNSMVIRIGAGEIGASVSQLVKDVRKMMEPGTASRLKVNDHFPIYVYDTKAALRLGT